MLNVKVEKIEKVDVADVIAKTDIRKDHTFIEKSEKVKTYLTNKFGTDTKVSGYEINNIVCEINVALK